MVTQGQGTTWRSPSFFRPNSAVEFVMELFRSSGPSLRTTKTSSQWGRVETSYSPIAGSVVEGGSVLFLPVRVQRTCPMPHCRRTGRFQCKKENHRADLQHNNPLYLQHQQDLYHEDLRRDLVSSFVGNNKEVEHQCQHYLSHKTSIWQGHLCSLLYQHLSFNPQTVVEYEGQEAELAWIFQTKLDCLSEFLVLKHCP